MSQATLSESAPTLDEAPPSARRLAARPHLVFWVPTLVVVAVAMVRNSDLFSTTVHEGGDEALNSLLVIRAEHFQQLVGNYSRVGFHHPGPALFYVLAAGQAFFHDLLHVAAPYNGELLGAIVFSAVLIGLTVLAIYRLTNSLAASAVAFGAIFLFAANHAMFADVWFPYLYMAPFLLFITAGAALAAGHTSELVSYTLAAGVLVHGHVSFIAFVLVTSVAVGVCWPFTHEGDTSGSGGRARRGALALGALFLLPIVVELVRHRPGPWRSYLGYVRHGHNMPRSVGDVVGFIRWYWSGEQVATAVVIVSLIVATALTVTERSRQRRRDFLCVYGMLVLQSVLFVFYVGRGVDALTDVNRYVGFFYLTVPLMLVAAAAMQLSMRIADAAPEVTVHGAPRRIMPWFAVAVSLLLVLAAAVTPRLEAHPKGDAAYVRIVDALQSAKARTGRTIALDFPHDSWPQAAGVAIQAQRRHVPWCILNTRWTNLYTADYVCHGTTPKWVVALVPSTGVPAHTTVVWRGDHLAVYVKPSGPRLLPANP